MHIVVMALALLQSQACILCCLRLRIAGTEEHLHRGVFVKRIERGAHSVGVPLLILVQVREEHDVARSHAQRPRLTHGGAGLHTGVQCEGEGLEFCYRLGRPGPASEL